MYSRKAKTNMVSHDLLIVKGMNLKSSSESLALSVFTTKCHKLKATTKPVRFLRFYRNYTKFNYRHKYHGKFLLSDPSLQLFGHLFQLLFVFFFDLHIGFDLATDLATKGGRGRRGRNPWKLGALEKSLGQSHTSFNPKVLGKLKLLNCWAWRCYYLYIIYKRYIYIYINILTIYKLINKSNISSKPVTYLPPTWGCCDSLQTSLKCFVGGANYLPPLTAEDMLGVIFPLICLLYSDYYMNMSVSIFTCTFHLLQFLWYDFLENNHPNPPPRFVEASPFNRYGLLRPFFRSSTSSSRSRALRSHGRTCSLMRWPAEVDQPKSSIWDFW